MHSSRRRVPNCCNRIALLGVMMLTACSNTSTQSVSATGPRDIEHEISGHLVGSIERAATTLIEAHKEVPRFYADIRDLNVSEYPNDTTMKRLMMLDEKAPGSARAMALRWHEKATAESEYALRGEWAKLQTLEPEKRAKHFNADYRRKRLNYYSRNWSAINKAIDAQLRATG